MLLDLVSAVGRLPLGPAALICKLLGVSSSFGIRAKSAVGGGSVLTAVLPRSCCWLAFVPASGFISGLSSSSDIASSVFMVSLGGCWDPSGEASVLIVPTGVD